MAACNLLSRKRAAEKASERAKTGAKTRNEDKNVNSEKGLGCINLQILISSLLVPA